MTESSTPSSSRSNQDYRSDAARRTYTVTTGIVGVVFIVAQFVLPFVVMFPLMGVMMTSDMFRIRMPLADRGTWWKDRVWYPEMETSFDRAQRSGLTLLSVDPHGESVPESVGSIPVDDPWLIGASDVLWIISAQGVATYSDGEVRSVSRVQLGTISEPFLFEGYPAVMEQIPGKVNLEVLVDGAWEDRIVFPAERVEQQTSDREITRVVPEKGTLHVFEKYGDTIFHRRFQPDDKTAIWSDYEPVATVSGAGWAAASLDGAPVVFYAEHHGFVGTIIGLRRRDNAWERFFEHPTRTDVTDLAVYSGITGRQFYVSLSGFPGAMRLIEVVDGTVVRETTLGKGFVPFGGAFFPALMLTQYLPMLGMPLLLALVLSALMRRHRVGVYETDSGTATQAPLWRRAIAQAVDAAILFGPMALGFMWWMMSFMDPEKMFDPFRLLSTMGLVFGGALWGLMGLVLFSFLEGAWGRTPGKWLTGIQVLGVDLRPCGFGRGLIRNLLKFVDGFFNFTVGILVVALSEKWQRVGDMAARTVVVLAPSRRRS